MRPGRDPIRPSGFVRLLSSLQSTALYVLVLHLPAINAILAEDTAPSADQKHDALQSIESTRGGRHWVDAKTDPPKTPEASLKCIQIEPGLRIELVAAEPLVMDPVSIAFDQQGRMFVVEYGDYPTGPPNEGDPPLSRIVMLEDTNNDGRMDGRHVFADRLKFAHSLMAYRGGMLVGAQTEILFLQDTDEDQIADVRNVLFKGFTPAHPQMQIGNPRWGLDNWIYCNYGPGEITMCETIAAGSSATPSKINAPAKPHRSMPRKEFRFHPLTMQFGPAGGLGQFGNTIDNFGHRFFCTNRNPIITAPMSYAQLHRNPFIAISKDQYDVAPSGGDARIYPLVEMKSNYLSHAGTYTSACGTTAYRGDLLKAEFENSVFVCEPIGHLVTRSIVRRVGVKLTAQRARPTADFLASTDSWFRPVGLANGPDGALYLADMYRLWVEHPKFLPEETAKRLDWRAGDDRGRIWRVVPEDSRIKRRRFDPPETTEDLVAMLADSNGWRRQLAQRLLVERQSQDAAPMLREFPRTGKGELARLHALWTLDGLGKLTAADLINTFDDSDVHVRRDAVSLSARFLKNNASLLSHLAPLARNNDLRVRFQVALALGETSDPLATKLLTELALRDGSEPWFATAILTSVKERSGAVLVSLIRKLSLSSGLDQTPKPAIQYASLVRQLATVAGARGDSDELALVLKSIGGFQQSDAWWQTSAISGLATGLPRHRGELGRISLSKLLAKPPQALAGHVETVRAFLERTASFALDRTRPLGDRAGAIELLGVQPFEQSAAAFQQLLATSQPAELHLACIEAMQNGNGAAAKMVIQHWSGLGPRVRPAALGLLLRRTGTTRLALEAMAIGGISPAIVDIDRRVRLLRHHDPDIKALALKLFGGAVSANRREVAKQYADALMMEASAGAGLKVFDRACSKCHRIGGRGYEVGPDISDVRNRSREALLHDILDPNQKVEPRFTSYLVVTSDGRIFNGLMVSETEAAVILRQTEGRQEVIARDDIEDIRSSGTSLMPDGFEKDITVQQMADLLEYLKSRGLSSNVAAGGK